MASSSEEERMNWNPDRRFWLAANGDLRRPFHDVLTRKKLAGPERALRFFTWAARCYVCTMRS